MGRLFAETTWGCSTLRRKTTLSILVVSLGIVLSGCSRPAAPAAAASPEPSKPSMEPAPAVSTQEQTLVVALDKELDCKFDILPRTTSKRACCDYDIKQVTDKNLATFLKAKADPSPAAPSSPEPIAAPRELIEVWVAVGDIPPKAVITRQLVDAKLKKINVSKERAEGAISDLTSLLDQELTLESGLRQGQWLTASLVGPPLPAAQAESQPLEVAPMPRVVKPKKYKDVTITTSSGTRIYRYEEVAPDKFKLVGEFAPDDTRKATGRAATPPKKAGLMRRLGLGTRLQSPSTSFIE